MPAIPFTSYIRSFFKQESASFAGHRPRYWLLLAVSFILFSGATSPAAETDTIVLRAEPLPFTPKEFYIAAVNDERPNQATVGTLVPVSTTPAAKPAAPRPVDLQGGGLAAIRQYIRKSLPANPKFRPVIIRLQQCKVTETAAANGRVAGQVEVAMAFDLQREGEPVQLLTYKGGARYNRPVSQQTVVEPALRQSLEEALRYLNTWMDQEADHNPKLARSLIVSIKDYTRNADDDTVFYAPARPLTWDDFQAPPTASSSFAASVFPSFAYEGQTDVVNGVIHLDLEMKVYVLRGSSWVKAAARNAYSLNHEQRHFDIVKLVAERFKQKIQPDNLTLEDYNSIIQYQYLESFREMNRLQEQYDGETQHGLNEAAQQRWSERIEKELQAYGIKK
ncbi:hypothetical protein [Pontibacter chitinilyticus]|uniref:hypothetical protein n=1 Tax=Pontibacter chitinilyticus TaxID=2674989 RepID=UPI00321A50A8